MLVFLDVHLIIYMLGFESFDLTAIWPSLAMQNSYRLANYW